MGIAVNELLALDFFRDFRVIAGKDALHKEVQGIAIMDSPDAFRWSKGKEMVITSGYAISQDPACIRRAFDEGSILGTSALMIKRNRYLDNISDDMIGLFDRFGIPLISMPFEVPFMDVQKQVNVAVINRAIRRFRINSDHNYQLPELSYKEQKIRRILQAVEAEMHFPAFIYDISEEKSYYSSVNFKNISARFGLTDADYWNPSREVSRNMLCDYLSMTRFRLIDNLDPNGPRISWVLTPITVNNSVMAYFVIMESKEFIDYYDEYSIRIAYLQLQAVYEQLVIASSIGDIGFENYVLFALNSREEDSDQLLYQARQHGFSVNSLYNCILFSQTAQGISARSRRQEILNIFHRCSICSAGKLVFLEENEGLILIDAGSACASEEGLHGSGRARSIIKEFNEKAAQQCPDLTFEYAFSCDRLDLTGLRAGVAKCRSILRMGRLLYPGEQIWDYDMLGPITWLDIPEHEIEFLLSDYKKLLQDPRNIEPLKTLKVYLASNMNYSVTAARMYVHINTIWKRIERIDEILDIRWDDYISRLRIQLILQLLGL